MAMGKDRKSKAEPRSHEPGRGEGKQAKGFERVAGPGPKDAGKGAAGPEAKERLDRNH